MASEAASADLETSVGPLAIHRDFFTRKIEQNEGDTLDEEAKHSTSSASGVSVRFVNK